MYTIFLLDCDLSAKNPSFIGLQLESLPATLNLTPFSVL